MLKEHKHVTAQICTEYEDCPGCRKIRAKPRGIKLLLVTVSMFTEDYGRKHLDFIMRDDETYDEFFKRIECIKLYMGQDMVDEYNRK